MVKLIVLKFYIVPLVLEAGIVQFVLDFLVILSPDVLIKKGLFS